MLRCWFAFALAVLSVPLYGQEPPSLEDPSRYPLMGDWAGRMSNPKGWPDSKYPQLSAHILPMNPGEYKVVLVKDLYRRAQPLAEFTVPSDGREIVIDQQGWKLTFQAGLPAKGTVQRGSHVTHFELQKSEWAPPTLGAPPPEGARVLKLEDWEHTKGRAMSWTWTNGVMETVGQSWNRGQNR